MRLSVSLLLSTLLGVSLVLQTGLSEAQEVRTWTDSTGKHRIEARLLEMQGDFLILEELAGTKKRIPLDKLSAADQAFARDAMSAGSSPFETVEDSPFAPVPATSSSAPAASATGPRNIDVDYMRAAYEIPIRRVRQRRAVDHRVAGGRWCDLGLRIAKATGAVQISRCVSANDQQ
jgi:hypothetical protein